MRNQVRFMKFLCLMKLCLKRFNQELTISLGVQNRQVVSFFCNFIKEWKQLHKLWNCCNNYLQLLYISFIFFRVGTVTPSKSWNISWLDKRMALAALTTTTTCQLKLSSWPKVLESLSSETNQHSRLKKMEKIVQ